MITYNAHKLEKKDDFRMIIRKSSILDDQCHFSKISLKKILLNKN